MGRGRFLFGGMGFWVAIVAIASRLKERLPAPSGNSPCVLKMVRFFVALAGIVLHDVPVTIVGSAVGALVGGTF